MLGYVSVIARQVDGIFVDGSYAWAQFNANDQVVAESVWWPAISAATLNEAEALRTKMADKSQAGAYRSKLPSDITALDGSVVITCPAPMHWSATQAVAFRPNHNPSRYFDGSGVEFAF